MTDEELERLLPNQGIIRNRLKIYAARKNASAFLQIQKEFGSFSNYVWRFVDHKPIVNRRKSLKDIPASTPISDALSKDLKKRGMTFVGSTIMYAFMQAVGLVDDHLVDCWCANRKLNEPLLKKTQSQISDDLKPSIFHFIPALSSQRNLIHSWLEQPHLKEWIHGTGLQNTFNGLEEFFAGESDTTYWIGYHVDISFAFLITSPEGTDAITLDVFICDLNYLGKGLSVSMIQEFLLSQFPNVQRVLIDPEATNIRAIHVYQKVGFKIIGEFIASWHPVPHYQMELYMKDLKNK